MKTFHNRRRTETHEQQRRHIHRRNGSTTTTTATTATTKERPYNNALAIEAAAKNDGLSISNNKKTVFIQREQKTFSKQEPDQLLESIEKAQVRLSGKSLQMVKEHLQQASNSLYNAIEDAIKTLHINEQSYATPAKANNVAKVIENFLGKMYGYIPMQSFPLCEKDALEQKAKFTSILHNPNMQCESSLLFTELVSFVHPQNSMKQKDEFLIILSQGQHYKKPAYSPTEWYKLAICIQRINQDTKQTANKKNIITMSTLETEQFLKTLNNNKSNLAKFFPVTLGFINNNQQSSLKLMLNKTVSNNWTINPYMEAFQFQEMQSRQSTAQEVDPQTPVTSKRVLKTIRNDASSAPKRRRATKKRTPVIQYDDDDDDDDENVDPNAGDLVIDDADGCDGAAAASKINESQAMDYDYDPAEEHFE